MVFKISSVVSWLIRLQLLMLSIVSSRSQLLPVWRMLALSAMFSSDRWQVRWREIFHTFSLTMSLCP